MAVPTSTTTKQKTIRLRLPLTTCGNDGGAKRQNRYKNSVISEECGGTRGFKSCRVPYFYNNGLRTATIRGNGVRENVVIPGCLYRGSQLLSPLCHYAACHCRICLLFYPEKGSDTPQRFFLFLPQGVQKVPAFSGPFFPCADFQTNL